MSTKQWQCGHCGAWVDTAWGHHSHIQKSETPSLEELIMRRRVEEMGGSTASLDGNTPVVKYWRTFKEPTRDTPPHG